ncbi:unnamed protein product [Urochloa humidicola]
MMFCGESSFLVAGLGVDVAFRSQHDVGGEFFCSLLISFAIILGGGGVVLVVSVASVVHGDGIIYVGLGTGDVLFGDGLLCVGVLAFCPSCALRAHGFNDIVDSPGVWRFVFPGSGSPQSVGIICYSLVLVGVHLAGDDLWSPIYRCDEKSSRFRFTTAVGGSIPI